VSEDDALQFESEDEVNPYIDPGKKRSRPTAEQIQEALDFATLDAVETLHSKLKSSDDKIAVSAATEICDRNGVAKKQQAASGITLQFALSGNGADLKSIKEEIREKNVTPIQSSLPTPDAAPANDLAGADSAGDAE
jgi:hypothetical protein